ncbi:hypothetical protein STANM309S_05137 [Streptomyces tanashiensis]
MLTYLVDTFDALHAGGAERPRMMSVGRHCRIIGRPGRIRALDAFLRYVARRGGAWVATREQIARHWLATHPPTAEGPRRSGGAPVGPRDRVVRQATLTAAQAAATVAYSGLVAPYRSFAAFRVAVRAPL